MPVRYKEKASSCVLLNDRLDHAQVGQEVTGTGEEYCTFGLAGHTATLAVALDMHQTPANVAPRHRLKRPKSQ